MNAHAPFEVHAPRNERSPLQTLEIVRAYIERERWSPSLREIAALAGIPSVSTVAWHLDKLETMGLIERKQDGTRQIRIPKGE